MCVDFSISTVQLFSGLTSYSLEMYEIEFFCCPFSSPRNEDSCKTRLWNVPSIWNNWSTAFFKFIAMEIHNSERPVVVHITGHLAS